MVAETNSTVPPADRVLVITRVLDAPRSLVFSMWTQPEHLVRWWGPKDFTLPFCETEFRVGGSYRYCMRAPDGVDYWVWGTYREIVEPERIVFTWGREDAEGNPIPESIVTVTLAEHENGKTMLTLHHAVFTTVEDRDAHIGGWTECLERLAQYVAQAHR